MVHQSYAHCRSCGFRRDCVSHVLPSQQTGGHMKTDVIYKALDIKNKTLIQKTCPTTVIDGVEWYDTSEYVFSGERLYLESRGIIVIHPVNTFLVRFLH